MSKSKTTTVIANLFHRLKKARSKLQIVDSSPRIQFTNVCQNLPPTASCDATPYLNSDLTSRKNESNPYLTAEDINNFCGMFYLKTNLKLVVDICLNIFQSKDCNLFSPSLLLIPSENRTKSH